MQSVFEKIKERLEESGKEIYREPTVKDPPGCSLIPTGEKDLLVSKAIEIVNQVAEEYGDGWIPCSERLPDGHELWLGNDITDAEPREFILMVKGAYEPSTGYFVGGRWVKDIFNQEENCYADEIIAWRFFPAPYQPKGE